MIGGDDDRRGNARQITVLSLFFLWKYEWNQRGARSYNFQTELTRQIVALGGRTDLGNGGPPRGHDQDWSAEFCGVGAQDEFGGVLNFLDFGIQNDLNIGVPALGFQHVGNVLSGTVAEKLA